MGIKPLYYSQKAGIFSFASELKALLRQEHLSKDLNKQSLYDYLSLQYVPAPGTIFKDIQKLPAARYFRYHLERRHMEVRPYWHLPKTVDYAMSPQEAVSRVRAQTERAVNEWSMSDVPLGCSLSGGIDSSAVCGIISRYSHNQLKTFSLGFSHSDESDFDERPLARLSARKWNTQHHETVIAADDLLSELGAMAWHLDEPYGGGLPSWYVFKAMKAQVKVAMTGTGGDELFGVYGHFRRYEYPRWYLRELAKLFSLEGLSLRTLKNLRVYPQGYLYHRYFTETMKRAWVFDDSFAKDCRPTEAYLQELWDEAKDHSLRDRISYIHFKTQLPEEFLHMTDRFSMAHSIEARTPLLDHKLVEAVMSIPASLRIKPRGLKYLFIEAMKEYVPPEIINAPKKGFVLPVDRWLRGPLKDDVLTCLGKSALRKQGIFSDKLYDHIIKPYFGGRYCLKNCVWTVFMFQAWYKQYCN